MATLDLDPLFLRCLKLLHCKDDNAVYHLKEMMDETIKLKKNRAPPSAYKEVGANLPVLISKSAPVIKIEPAEKRTSDMRGDDVEVVRDLTVKRMRVDSPKTLTPTRRHSATPSPTPSAVGSGRPSDDSDGDTDQMALLNIMEGLACVICSGMDVVSGNQLVECQECHALYHQECHLPHISESQVNDPRGIWYCDKCSPQHTKHKLVGAESSSKSSSKSKSPSVSSSKSSLYSNLSGVKPISTSKNRSSTPPASSSSSRRSKNSSGSPASASSTTSGVSSIIEADRRLQMMKKKAAMNVHSHSIKHIKRKKT